MSPLAIVSFLPAPKVKLQLVYENEKIYDYPNNADDPNDIVDNLGVGVCIFVTSSDRPILGDYWLDDFKTICHYNCPEAEAFVKPSSRKIIGTDDERLYDNGVSEVSAKFIQSAVLEFNNGMENPSFDLERDIFQMSVSNTFNSSSKVPIIELRNIGDFERLLFANNHIKCLKKIIEVKDKMIKDLTEKVDAKKIVYSRPKK
jgi:hypothetical protein